MISEFTLKAILAINPSAKCTIHNDDTTKIDWLDGTTPISQSDIEAKIPIIKQEILDEETEKANNKTSATNKLKALGLTDAEIEAL